MFKVLIGLVILGALGSKGNTGKIGKLCKIRCTKKTISFTRELMIDIIGLIISGVSTMSGVLVKTCEYIVGKIEGWKNGNINEDTNENVNKDMNEGNNDNGENENNEENDEKNNHQQKVANGYEENKIVQMSNYKRKTT